MAKGFKNRKWGLKKSMKLLCLHKKENWMDSFVIGFDMSILEKRKMCGACGAVMSIE